MPDRLSSLRAEARTARIQLTSRQQCAASPNRRRPDARDGYGLRIFSRQPRRAHRETLVHGLARPWCGHPAIRAIRDLRRRVAQAEKRSESVGWHADMNAPAPTHAVVRTTDRGPTGTPAEHEVQMAHRSVRRGVRNSKSRSSPACGRPRLPRAARSGDRWWHAASKSTSPAGILAAGSEEPNET